MNVTPCDWYWLLTFVPSGRSSKPIVVSAAQAFGTATAPAAMRTATSRASRAMCEPSYYEPHMSRSPHGARAGHLPRGRVHRGGPPGHRRRRHHRHVRPLNAGDDRDDGAELGDPLLRAPA